MYPVKLHIHFVIHAFGMKSQSRFFAKMEDGEFCLVYQLLYVDTLLSENGDSECFPSEVLDIYREELTKLQQEEEDLKIATILREMNIVDEQAVISQIAETDAQNKRRREALELLVQQSENEPTTSQDPRQECVACFSKSITLYKAPCGHKFCMECLATHCRSGFRDRCYWPVKCCSQDLPLHLISDVFTPSELRKYNLYFKELEDAKVAQDAKLEDDQFKIDLVVLRGKRCPGCKIGIYRIDGCPNVTCTYCKLGFNMTSV